MSSPKSRRKFTVDEKVAILRRHLVDKVAVSELCEQYHIQPSVFYVWQRQMWENLEAVFETSKRTDREARCRREEELAGKLKALEAKLVKKDGVIAEISAEYVQLKKDLGEL
jgi:transposase-like protein